MPRATIKDEEIAEAENNGIDPVEYVIARDAIAVIVNPSNPVQQLTLQQISDIYTRRDQQLDGAGRGRPADCAPFARDQLRHARLFSGSGDPPGQQQG